MTDEWSRLAASLESSVARQQLTKALTDADVVEGPALGGSLADTLTHVPPSRLASDRAQRALGLALAAMETELTALRRRANACFTLVLLMGAALAGAILWAAIGMKAGEGLDAAKILATLGSTAGGGAMFVYYQYLSKQTKALINDLRRLSESPLRRRAPAQAKTP
jgi:hypothetical protein